MLPSLNITNKLAEKTGTIAAADEVDKIEAEHVDYDISTKGFIEDIDAVEKENTKRIVNKELENKDFRWLEEQLASLNEEFSRRTGIPIPSPSRPMHPEDEKEEEDIDTNDEDAEEEGDANDGVYSDSEANSDDEDPDDVAIGEESK
jgi:hypothetical protein